MAKEAPSLPYAWLRAIPRAIAEKDKIPLLGFPPQFPWEEIASKLQGVFGLNSLELTGSSPEWRAKTDLFKGLGEQLNSFNISIPGMEGVGYLVFEEGDLQYLMGLILTQKASPFPVQDVDFQKGFLQFFGLEILFAIGESSFDPSLAPHLQEENSLPETDALTLDVLITLERKKITGRFFLTKELQQSIRKHYAEEAEYSAAKGRLSQKLEVELHMELGGLQMSQIEWESVALGDFLVLDNCSWIPEEEKGRVILTLNRTPLFRGRLKKGKIKILEYPLYYEVDTMTSKIPDDETEDLTFSDEESEFDEDETEEELSEAESDRALEHLEKEKNKEEDEEEEPEDEEETPIAGVKAATSAPLASPKEIPLQVVVEAGRLKMTIQKLSELSPGNILELNIRPEAGVDLVINGRTVAKGELLKIGETLGVRVLEVG